MYVPVNREDSLYILDRAFEWADKYELRILLSLFGLPGSQNGLASSGCTNFGTRWHEQENRVLSLSALATIADRYGGRESLLGIEVMDRPSEILMQNENYFHLMAYYLHSYEVIRSRSSNAIIAFHEAILSNLSQWRNLYEEPTFFNVALDVHLYTSPEVSLLANYSQIITSTGTWASLVETESTFNPIIVGEWSLVAKVGDISHVSRRIKQEFINAEQKAMSSAFGSFTWTWKVEYGLDDEDSLQKQLSDVNGLRLS